MPFFYLYGLHNDFNPNPLDTPQSGYQKFEETNRKIRSNSEKQRLDPVGWQLIQESNDAKE
jgi:hypothetical protein